MPEVKIYSILGRGSEFVHSSTRDEGPCVLFVPHMEVDGHRIRTVTPEAKLWEDEAKKNGYTDEHIAKQPEDGWPQPTLSVGEGFMTLTIKHADDETWTYLSSLPDDAYGEGSTRESFDVLVTHLEYIPLEPEDGSPWLGDEGPRPTGIADLERPAS